MQQINLKYGRTEIPFEYDETKIEILGDFHFEPSLTDAQIGEKLNSPIGCEPLETIVGPDETVLVVVPDATRRSGAGQIVNLLVRRLIANGTAPHQIAAIFSTGIHRSVTEEEKQEVLTPFIAQRVKTLHHDARDLMQIVRVGETSGGIAVELNRALFDFDHVVLVGSVSFHYFAGFTGGRKLVCPGLASAGTISATHKLAFDCDAKDRRAGVGTGLLDGNAVHETFVEAASFAKISFSINTLLNDAGEITGLFCGDWQASHKLACETFAEQNTIKIEEKRDLVIVSCGGYPNDINMIQAHKSLEGASHVCKDGGTIILLAECRDGLGRDDFLNWFEAKDSGELAAQLCEKYQVNGQTAWSLLRKAEQFRIEAVTSLKDAALNAMRIKRSETKKRDECGYIVPNGGRILIKT